MSKPKPFDIPQQRVWEAYKRIRANKGAAGVDEESLEEFERDLENNLYRIWNRMASGSYLPPPVKAVPIPKKSGGTRMLGVPTVSDRIAQMVVKLGLEPLVEPHFHADSYGYRPGKSAHQAIETTRQRCWEHDWVLEFDIRGLFDHIDHGLLMKAVRKHTNCKWIILYIERWLKAPMQLENGERQERNRGTPQGGVISPLLANLFLHYAFDRWMSVEFSKLPFCRYADDGLIHCRSQKQARFVLARLAKRLKECGLELHPDKTHVVYCKDVHRQENHDLIQFDFLGYTFKPRKSKGRGDCLFVNFSPGVSREAGKAVRQEVRNWRLHLKSDQSIEELARTFGPVIRGWVNYYCRFRKSAFHITANHFNSSLTRWAMRKFKRFRGHYLRALHWIGKIAHQCSHLFAHWEKGFAPAAG